MASYATIASTASTPSDLTSTVVSPNFTRGDVPSIQSELAEIMTFLQKANPAPSQLVQMIESLRNDMEIPQGNSRGGGGIPRFPSSASASSSSGSNSSPSQGRNFSQNQPTSNWRNGSSVGNKYAQSKSPAFDTRPTPTNRPSASHTQHSSSSGTQPRPNPGRYQSKFVTEGNLNDKILNSIIGNKLNSFTPLTYNDTRDFIYQIIDSGETEFVKDFIEKVFAKATVEELYCALFAKLIAEIAHRYPIMYEEMKRYHGEFLKVFDDVDEGHRDSTDSDSISKKRQYRLGYGQFISELASLNALEKEQLLAMVSTVMDKIWAVTEAEDKIKTVEEFIDCLVRLTKSLSEKSSRFYSSVKGDIKVRILERVDALVNKTAGNRPSLSVKARFGLMDLKDLL